MVVAITTAWRLPTPRTTWWRRSCWKTRLPRRSQVQSHNSILRCAANGIHRLAVNGSAEQIFINCICNSDFYCLCCHAQVWSGERLTKTIDVETLKKHGTINEDSESLYVIFCSPFHISPIHSSLWVIPALCWWTPPPLCCREREAKELFIL